MRVKRELSLLIVLLIAGIGSFLFLGSRPKPAPDPQARLKEEHEVYSVVLGDAVYRLEENTTLGRLSINAEDNSDFSNLGWACGSSPFFTNRCTLLGYKAPTVSKETVIDFRENNRQPYPLRDYLPSSNNHILISSGDIEHLPESGVSAWVSLSRIGFNPTFTQALVLLNWVAKIDGHVDTCSQFYKILEKADGSWVLQTEFRIVDCVMPPSQN